MNITATHTRHKRPPAVTIVGWLFIFFAPISALGGLVDLWALLVRDPNQPLVLSWHIFADLDAERLGVLVTGGYALVNGVLYVLIGIGLLQLRPRAWLWAMFVLGISLAENLVGYWSGTPDFLDMALNALLVLLLNQTEVRETVMKDEG